jgi:hypothetical protein
MVKISYSCCNDKKLVEIDRMYWCIDCKKARCDNCVELEVLNCFCPQCLFPVPRTNITRCPRNCLECPNCYSILSTSSPSTFICNFCYLVCNKPHSTQQNILLEMQKYLIAENHGSEHLRDAALEIINKIKNDSEEHEKTFGYPPPQAPLLRASYIKRCHECEHILVKPSGKTSDPFLILYKASNYLPVVRETGVSEKNALNVKIHDPLENGKLKVSTSSGQVLTDRCVDEIYHTSTTRVDLLISNDNGEWKVTLE